ncbi:MAG TPA: Fic family protein [Rhizomicrobium sp.]|nr:Fic family protein [Rhizomicrobium sp.]
MGTYIHELPGWPHFRWSQQTLADRLAAVRHRQGRLLGRLEGFGLKLRDEAALQTLTEEIVSSSEIEGEELDQNQVRSSLARRLGIDIGALTPADRAVEGFVQMMLDATQNYDMPLTAARLFGWHAALFPTGWSGLKKIAVGRWRDAEAGAMQVVSGPPDRERVHFEAPDAARVDEEMTAFLAWIDGGNDIDPVLKAAIAHLWFVTIHPFEDGNGRIARAIADMMLARSEKSAQRFYSISAQIRKERGKYYDHLEEAQKGDLEITAHLGWFLDCLDRAFDGAEIILADVLRKARFWERHADASLNARQRLVINRLLDGFEGKLTSSKWAKLTRTSQDTAARDIDDLVQRSILVKEPGRGRSTSYRLIVTPADALGVIADYARAYAHMFVRNGTAMLSPEETDNRKADIEKIAAEIDALAGSPEKIVCRDFEPLLEKLHKAGFFPDDQLIAAFAQAAAQK